MNVLYKLFCRGYQAVFRAIIPVLPYRQPQRLDAAQLEQFYTRMTGEQERAA